MSLARANPHNTAVKRIMREFAEFQKEPNEHFVAAPCEDNLFEWHFTLRGLDDSEFAGGRYHGRILLPSAYPFKPPDIIMLTPSGRFETHKKICLSISSFHPDHWQPSWSIRTVLTALIAFFPTPGNGAIGSLDYNSDERRKLARLSANWMCELCQKTNAQLLPESTNGTHQPVPQLVLPSSTISSSSTTSPSPTNTATPITPFSRSSTLPPSSPALFSLASAPADASATLSSTPPSASSASSVASSSMSPPPHPPSTSTSSPCTPVKVSNNTIDQQTPIFTRAASDLGHIDDSTILNNDNHMAHNSVSSRSTFHPSTPSALSPSPASLSSSASSSLSPSTKDEQQNEGEIIADTTPSSVSSASSSSIRPSSADSSTTTTTTTTSSVASSSSSSIPAVAPAPGRRPAPASTRVTNVTVLIAFFILLILLRKLHGHITRGHIVAPQFHYDMNN